MPRVTPTIKLERFLDKCYNTEVVGNFTPSMVIEMQEIYNTMSSHPHASVDTLSSTIADTCKTMGFKVEIHGVGWKISK